MTKALTTSSRNQLAEAMGGELLEDNKQYTNRMEIRSSSSNKLYVIAQRKSDEEWCCGCPGWVFKKKGQERNCKHLKTLRPLLEGLGAVAVLAGFLKRKAKIPYRKKEKS